MRDLPAFSVRLLTLALCVFGVASAQCETAPTVAEILDLKGEALIEAVKKVAPRHGETELPAADLLALLDKLAAEGAGWNPKDDRWFLYAELIEATLKKARGEELDRATKASTLLPADFLYRPKVFVSVVSALAARETEAIRAEKREPLHISPTTAPQPVALAKASQEIRAAWAFCQSIYHPQKAAMDPKDPSWINFQSDNHNVAEANRAKFSAVLDRLILGETQGVLEELSRFRWGSWCGTGADLLSSPLSWARWLALMRERRLAEAASATLDLHFSFLSAFDGDDSPDQVRREFLQACGVDWEMLTIGFLAAALADRDESGRGVPVWLALGENGPARALAADGSERGVRWLLELAALAPHGQRRDYAKALDILLKPKGYEHGHGIYSTQTGPHERRAPEPLSQDVQDEAVQILVRWLAEPGDGYMLSDVVKTLATTKSPAVREPLHSALTHEAPGVGEAAAAALREMGEEVAPPPERGPVRFRIVVNGQPYAGRRIEPAVKSKTMGSTTELTTDDRGIALVSRDFFTDPQFKDAKFTLTARPPLVDIPDPDSAMPAAAKKAISGWFSVELQKPQNLDAEIPVIVRAEPVTFILVLNRSADFYRGKKATIGLLRHDAKNENSYDYGVASWSLPIAPQIVLPAVQNGRYSVTVNVPGASQWYVAELTLGAAAVQIRVPLVNGTDVHFKIREPGDEEGYVPAELMRDGKKQYERSDLGDDGWRIFRGLPAGRYVLHAPSSEEKRKEYPRDKNEIVEKSADNLGLDLPFEIPASVPPEMNLGEHTLTPAAK